MGGATSKPQVAVAGVIIAIALGLAFGALTIPGEAGYGGVGPNFLPWLVSAGLLVCGGLILREALTGGYRELEEPDHPAQFWPGAVLISAGLLANAALITTIGFILSCMLCYVLAVQGLRRAEGQRANTYVVDAISGFAISAPVYWAFTKFLAINLPGLTSTGWL
ncbi:tripartite tricarboxylate transporter TctB family protein [Ramlibacter sp. PS4R-6]|uniref:tripartite tricarboxylate transporter TctB family protein n=1 Tax=Ramlibacter sp. PS4R-6 TaxID=3133438 RepID=UPI00309784AA